MGIEILPLRYGHSDGHTDICYSENGEKLISCGGDGDVRIWNGFKDDDPIQTCVGEFILCVEHKNEHVLVGTDNTNVQLLSYTTGDRDGILVRFTAQVNHIAVERSHNWVALASEDMTVKVIELTSRETKTFSDLNGPALSVALCGKLSLLSVTCGDGKLKIFNTDDQSLVKEFDVLPKTNSFLNAKLLCRADFDHKYNKYFAYPDKDRIVILNVSDWSEAHVLTTEAITEPYSITSFSHCGNYIAAVTLKGDLIVWNLRSQRIVDYKKHPKETAITSIAWDPKENGQLAFSDSQGYVGLAIKCTDIEVCDFISTHAEEDNASVNTDDENVDFGDIQIDQDDDDNNENAISLDKLKKDILGPLDSDPEDDKLSVRSSTPRPRTPETPLQPPFMPSSTPEHLDPRYMCWNDVGVIRCYGSSLDDDTSGNKSIEVEFHDSTMHSSMMMANYQGYTMGSVSSAVLAVANNTTINVVPLSSSSNDWHLNLTEDQEIVCVATSQNLVCFGLASSFVHVCSVFGTQKAVLSVPGPIITMSACGHVLIIAYHAAPVRKDDQTIDMMLVKMQGPAVENHYIKAPRNGKVQWLGFSDVGTPCMMDGLGMVYLFPLQANLWLPFCDTTKEIFSPMDGFFITAVYESYGTIRGIRCKHSMYPGFTPRPTVGEISLQAPFVEMGTEKSQLEANLFTWSTLQIADTEKKYKESALKTFALAAKNNFDQRALELMEMLGSSQILTLAMKYTSKLNKKRLAERLTKLASELEDSESEAKASDSVMENHNGTTLATPEVVVKPNRQRLLLSVGKILAKQKNLSTPSSSSNSSTPQSTKANDQLQDTMNTPSCSKSFSGLTPQSLSILEDEPKNPFLKSLKKPKTATYNPLSLTDKFAGYNVDKEKEKENKGTPNDVAEKRKQPDTASSAEKNKEKQRKLDRFMFTKRT